MGPVGSGGGCRKLQASYWCKGAAFADGWRRTPVCLQPNTAAPTLTSLVAAPLHELTLTFTIQNAFQISLVCKKKQKKRCLIFSGRDSSLRRVRKALGLETYRWRNSTPPPHRLMNETHVAGHQSEVAKRAECVCLDLFILFRTFTPLER